MSDGPLKTLLLPFETQALAWPEGPAVFINGIQCKGVPPGTAVQQYFKPLAQSGATPEIPSGPYACALVLGSKQHRETLYFIGQALAHLQDNGLLVCAAANDAGGRRLKRDLQDIGLCPEGESKHKSQVVWAWPHGRKAPEWIQEGLLRPVLDGAFVSQPGIFGWDRVDAGSALLTAHLPAHALQGVGADFGCGYGYLADYVSTHCPGVTGIYCLDADYRAVEACRANLSGKTENMRDCLWTDLTTPQTDLPAPDWVVMNPPFHEGKASDIALGSAFIRTACAALKRDGALWMVANAHLPYESVLAQKFSAVLKVIEERGFKVFHARK